MGQYLRLMMDIQSGTLLDQPLVTRERYVTHRVGQARLTVISPAADIVGDIPPSLVVKGTAAPGAHVTILVTSAVGTTVFSATAGRDGAFSLRVAIRSAYLVRLNIGAQDGAGRTALVVRRLSE
jgi:hypothetical protein